MCLYVVHVCMYVCACVFMRGKDGVRETNTYDILRVVHVIGASVIVVRVQPFDIKPREGNEERKKEEI